MTDNASAELRALEDIAESCREMVSWLSMAYGDRVREILNEVLNNPRKLVAYEYSTGDQSSRAVATTAGVSDRSIRDWWAEWSMRGLVIPTDVEGRYRKRFDLRKLGLPVPNVEEMKK